MNKIIPEPQNNISLTLATIILVENINRVMARKNIKIHKNMELGKPILEIIIDYVSNWKLITCFHDNFITINEYNQSGYLTKKATYYEVCDNNNQTVLQVTNIIAKYNGFTLKELYENLPDTEKCWLALRGITL